jgi:hypothetical protein
MLKLMKHAITIVAIGASCSLLGGCLLQLVLATFNPSSLGYTISWTGEATFSPCRYVGTDNGVNEFDCSWTSPTGEFYDSTVGIRGGGTDPFLVDPLILEVQADAKGIAGTYDNGSGLSGPLLVTTGLASVPIDATTNLVAEPGMQLVVVDLPPGTPVGTYNYTFNVSEFPLAVKAMFTGKVQVAGNTYYPPLLPCVTDFASVPAFEFNRGTFAPILTPALLSQIRGCNNKVYNFQSAATPNYEGLWWNAPAGSESGWGINFAHQGSVIFATWFTYDLTGKAWWLSMTATQTGSNTFSGTLYQTHGPAFDAMPFNPAAVTNTAVGNGTLTFSDANDGSFKYTVNGVTQTKTITRQVFGPLPTCTFGTQPNLALATNFQDLWWNAPAGSESGWGINFTQQGNIIFATWFTYDHDGTPLWLSATATNTAPGTYTGTLYRTTGPAFNATPFNPANVILTAVGTATLIFANGNGATFAYTVNGESQVKSITRQVFRAPGTVCQS